jgi:hypothetical protein
VPCDLLTIDLRAEVAPAGELRGNGEEEAMAFQALCIEKKKTGHREKAGAGEAGLRTRSATIAASPKRTSSAHGLPLLFTLYLRD